MKMFAPRRLRLLHDRSGLAAVELALILPILTLLLAATLNLGMGLHAALEVRNAAQAGAQYAALKGFDATATASAVTSATSLAGISASPAPSQMCGCPTATGISTISCSSSCSDGSSPGSYARIDAQTSFTPPIAFPGLAGPYALSAHVTVRLQ